MADAYAEWLRAANAPNHSISKITPEEIDHYFSIMPEELGNFIKNEGAVCWCPRSTYERYVMEGLEATLGHLRKQNELSRRYSYGEDFPKKGEGHGRNDLPISRKVPRDPFNAGARAQRRALALEAFRVSRQVREDGKAAADDHSRADG